VPIGIDRDGHWRVDPGLGELVASRERELPARLDPIGDTVSPGAALDDAIAVGDAESTVVVPLLHGPLGEDGTVQGLCELLDLPYVGSGVLASSLAMDKIMAKTVLGAAGVPQARWRGLHMGEISPATVDAIAADLALPAFVKPANMGSSVGISKARSPEELIAALHLAARYDEWLVVEEAVTCREIEVSVLGNLHPRASVPGEIVPSREFYDYEDKYVLDGARLVIPAALDPVDTERVRSLAIAAYRALRCEGMARVDFLFEEAGRGLLCNEVNTIPGFTPISMYPKLWQATGLGYADLIDELVSLAIERHMRRPRHVER
jgi:D-alanine-D-alanine ligase